MASAPCAAARIRLTPRASSSGSGICRPSAGSISSSSRAGKRVTVSAIHSLRSNSSSSRMLHQQHQVSAAPADGQHQVEHAVEAVLVQRLAVQPVQQLGHQAIQPLVGALAQGDPFQAPYEQGQRIVGIGCRFSGG